MLDQPQTLKYRIVLELSKIEAPVTTNNPEVPNSTKTEEGRKVITKVIEADSIVELKSGLADFRATLQEI